MSLVAQTWQGAFEPPASVPASADVVIIGGGIVGVSTAWFLSKQGVDVALCEKGHIAGEQSGRNWGWVRQQGRDTREMPMIIDSLNIWRGLAEEIGEDVGYHQGGCLFTISNDEQMARYAELAKIAKEFELDSFLVSAEKVAELVPGAAKKWRGGLYTASDGRAEPHKATPAIARAAVRNGASVLTACAVRGIETQAGKVSAVATEHGTIRTQTVLCAAGAWTSMFCRSLGVSVPQLKVKGTVARTSPVDNILDGNAFDDHIAIRKRQDGGYTVTNAVIMDHAITPSTFRYLFKFLPAARMELGSLRLSVGRDFIEEWKTPARWALDAVSPFEKKRVLNPEPNPKSVARIRENMDRMFPKLADAEIVETWAGMVETSPDVVPIIGEAEALPGFFIATGFSGHGFGIGPGAGRAIAGLLTGRHTGIDLQPFRVSRFFDGSPIEPQSSV